MIHKQSKTTNEYKTDISLTVIKAVKCGQLTMETTLGDIQDILKQEFGVTITQKELKEYLTKLVKEDEIKCDNHKESGADEDTWYVEEDNCSGICGYSDECDCDEEDELRQVPHSNTQTPSIELTHEKVETSGAGTKLAHLKVKIDISNETNDFAQTTWEVQCTGMGIVVKGNNNINSLRWFLDFSQKHNLDSKICKFANEVKKAHDLLTTSKEVK